MTSSPVGPRSDGGAKPPDFKAKVTPEGGAHGQIGFTEVTPGQSENAKRRGLLGFKKETSPDDIELAITSADGSYVKITNIPPELSTEIQKAREGAESFILEYNRTHPNEPILHFGCLDFKHLTCEVYQDDPNKVQFLDVPLSPAIKEVRRLLAEHKFVPTEGWPDMKPGQVSFVDTGTRVIGNLGKQLRGKEKEIILRLKLDRKITTPEGSRKIIFGKNTADTIASRITHAENLCKKIVVGCQTKIKNLRTELEGLQETINNKETTSPVRDDLNKKAITINDEIMRLETQEKAYTKLKTDRFALSWVVAFQSSSLAQSPFFNAQQSYCSLKEWLLTTTMVEEFSAKEINAYCAQVSSMLFLPQISPTGGVISSRGERVKFLLEHSETLEEISLDERVLNGLMRDKTDDQIVEELLKKPEPPKKTTENEDALRVQVTPLRSEGLEIREAGTGPETGTTIEMEIKGEE